MKELLLENQIYVLGFIMAILLMIFRYINFMRKTRFARELFDNGYHKILDQGLKEAFGDDIYKKEIRVSKKEFRNSNELEILRNHQKIATDDDKVIAGLEKIKEALLIRKQIIEANPRFSNVGDSEIPCIEFEEIGAKNTREKEFVLNEKNINYLISLIQNSPTSF